MYKVIVIISYDSDTVGWNTGWPINIFADVHFIYKKS